MHMQDCGIDIPKLAHRNSSVVLSAMAHSLDKRAKQRKDIAARRCDGRLADVAPTPSQHILRRDEMNEVEDEG